MAKKNDISDPAGSYFKGSEIEKRKDLNSLMKSWKETVAEGNPIVFHDDKKKYSAVDYFGSDGFMPGYFSASPRVVFVGRESRGNSGGLY